MKAGESPLNQGRTVWAPLSVSRRRSRGLRRTPQWGAERRAGTRYGPAIPFRRRDGFDRKANQRSRRSAAANFGAPLPSVGGAKGSKPTIWTEARRDVPRGNAPPRFNEIHEGGIPMSKFAQVTLHRHARPCAGHPRLACGLERRGWPEQVRP